MPVQVALEERALPLCPSSPSAPPPQNKVKREEKWRQVVHSLLRWMRTRKVWAALGQKLKALSGLNMDNARSGLSGRWATSEAAWREERPPMALFRS